MSSKTSFRRRLVYFGRHFTPTWRYLFNLQATLAYRRERQPLAGEAVRIVADLKRYGIALSSADRLFGQPANAACYAELAATVTKLKTIWADRREQARQTADIETIGRKTFLLQYLGEKPRLDPHSIYTQFSLQPCLLDIANAYFGMYTQLRYYNIWHTLTTTSQPRESQLWHYDREDHQILKLFVYMSDVDESAGPFTYAPGTHRQGLLARRPQTVDEQGVERWNDEQMDALVPKDKWIKAIGPAGTLVFADTRGYHKGGLARERERLLYTCLYTSPTSQAPELFERLPQTAPPASKAQARALALPSKGLFG